MARTDFKSVDEYVAARPPAAQDVLQRVRGAIRKALPGADEVISYQIPTFKRHGGYVVYFAAWKRHYSLYPASRELVEAFADELAPYAVSKGTIRFPLEGPVPAKLIERIARLMAKEAADRATSRARAKAEARSRPRKRDK